MFQIDIDQYMHELSTPKLSKGMIGVRAQSNGYTYLTLNVSDRDTRGAIGDEMGERRHIQLLVLDGFEPSCW